MNFQEYISTKSYDMAEAAIGDARDNGFAKEADQMELELEEARNPQPLDFSSGVTDEN